MTPGVQEVDELVSLAHRTGTGVRVELRLPGSALEPGTAEVRLSSSKRRFVVPADVVARDQHAATVTFTAPDAQLGTAVWQLAVRPATAAGGPFTRVRARLLAPPTQPVALLPGKAPATRLPAPGPRPRPSAAVRLARRLPEPAQGALKRFRGALQR